MAYSSLPEMPRKKQENEAKDKNATKPTRTTDLCTFLH